MSESVDGRARCHTGCAALDRSAERDALGVNGFAYG